MDNSPDSLPEDPFGALEWSSFLSAALGTCVEVRFGHARRRVLVAKPQAGGWRLQLNAGFGEAPRAVRDAVAEWLRHGKRARRACRELDAFVEELGRRMEAPARQRVSIRAEGTTHDLRPLLARVLREDLDAQERARLVPPQVSWGQRSRRARRSLQLGSFDPELNLIRIHPVLDQPAVAGWFVRFVLFHEVLHALYPPRRGAGGRIRHHPIEHVERERRHPGFERALVWQKEHIGALLRSARSGRPLARGKGSTGDKPRTQGLLFD